MPGTNAGTGQPIFFVCAVERREKVLWEMRGRYRPPGHDTVVRTGRVRPYKKRGQGGIWTMDESHEYVCTCGHRGWTAHKDILHYPVREEG